MRRSHPNVLARRLRTRRSLSRADLASEVVCLLSKTVHHGYAGLSSARTVRADQKCTNPLMAMHVVRHDDKHYVVARDLSLEILRTMRPGNFLLS